MPQHRFAHAVVEREHAVLAGDDGGVGAPGDSVHRLIDHHVGRHDPLVVPGALEVHVAPEVEQHRSVQRLRSLLEELRGRDHAVIDRLLEVVHGIGLLPFFTIATDPRLGSPFWSQVTTEDRRVFRLYTNVLCLNFGSSHTSNRMSWVTGIAMYLKCDAGEPTYGPAIAVAVTLLWVYFCR